MVGLIHTYFCGPQGRTAQATRILDLAVLMVLAIIPLSRGISATAFEQCLSSSTSVQSCGVAKIVKIADAYVAMMM